MSKITKTSRKNRQKWGKFVRVGSIFLFAPCMMFLIFSIYCLNTSLPTNTPYIGRGSLYFSRLNMKLTLGTHQRYACDLSRHIFRAKHVAVHKSLRFSTLAFMSPQNNDKLKAFCVPLLVPPNVTSLVELFI